MRKVYLILATGTLIFTSGCSSSPSSSTSSIPSLAAIAKAVLPSTLESSAVSLLNMSVIEDPQKVTKSHLLSADANLTTLKGGIFSPGSADFLYRLKMVDDRLTELSSAVSTCASLTTTTYTPPTVVTGFNFPMEFACKSNVDAASQGVSDYKIYYGKKDGYWYLGEFQTNAAFITSDGDPPSMVVLAKVKDDGTTMEVYQISVEYSSTSSVNYASVTQILANKTTAVFEVSSASSANISQTLSPGANMTGVGCGVRMKTNGTLVYASGQFSQDATCPSAATVCAAASDLSTATGCVGVVDSFTTLNMARADVSGNEAKSMIVDRTNLPSL